MNLFLYLYEYTSLWWHILDFYKSLRVTALATCCIPFFILKAVELVFYTIWKTKGDKETCCYKQWKQLYVQENLFLHIIQKLSTLKLSFNYLVSQSKNIIVWNGDKEIVNNKMTFHTVCICCVIRSLRVGTWKTITTPRTLLKDTFMLKTCLHSSASLPISIVPHGLEHSWALV